MDGQHKIVDWVVTDRTDKDCGRQMISMEKTVHGAANPRIARTARQADRLTRRCVDSLTARSNGMATARRRSRATPNSRRRSPKACSGIHLCQNKTTRAQRSDKTASVVYDMS